MSTLKELRDYVKMLTEKRHPVQHIKLCPVQYFDDLEADGTTDYFFSCCVGNRFIAFRITASQAIGIENLINMAIGRAMDDPKSQQVSIHNCAPEAEAPLTEVERST